jgi:hypothetical protein
VIESEFVLQLLILLLDRPPLMGQVHDRFQHASSTAFHLRQPNGRQS